MQIISSHSSIYSLQVKQVNFHKLANNYLGGVVLIVVRMTTRVRLLGVVLGLMGLMGLVRLVMLVDMMICGV